MPDGKSQICFEYTIQIPPPLDLFLYTPLKLGTILQFWVMKIFTPPPTQMFLYTPA